MTTQPVQEREERLTSLARAAGFPRATVFVSDQPADAGPEGFHNDTGFGGQGDPDVFVASWLSDPQAEATALHELAHVELGHDEDPGYAAAKLLDTGASQDRARAQWEIDADALAAALAASVAGSLADPDAVLSCLAEDAGRFG